MTKKFLKAGARTNIIQGSRFARPHCLSFETINSSQSCITTSAQNTLLIYRMTDKLPPNLLALFAPRPPLRWVPPSDHAPGERKTPAISSIAAFLPALQEYKETDVYEPTESWLQRKDRLELEKKQKQERLVTEGPLGCEGHPICFDCLLFSTVRLLGQRCSDRSLLTRV